MLRLESTGQEISFARILAGVLIWQSARYFVPPALALVMILPAHFLGTSADLCKPAQLLVLAGAPIFAQLIALVAVFKLLEKVKLRACSYSYYQRPVQVVDVCLGAAVGILLALTWHYLSSQSGAPNTGGSFDQPTSLTSSTLLAFQILTLISVVVAAPVAEEVFYRGLLLEALSKRVHVGWSVSVVTLIFTISHIGSIPNRLEAYAIIAVLAAAACLLTLRSGVIGGAIAMHFSFNVVPILLMDSK